MKRLILFSYAVLVSCTLLAQDDYFIFLQSENQQPYFVRVHEKRYDAASNGLLTIPGFSSGPCSLYIGFPGGAASERRFDFQIHQSDLGLQLRKNAEGQWALFDWKAKRWILPSERETAPPAADTARVETVKRQDAFASLMAAVVNDSSMLYTTVERPIRQAAKLVDSGYVIQPPPRRPDSAVNISGTAAGTVDSLSRGVVKSEPVPNQTDSVGHPPDILPPPSKPAVSATETVAAGVAGRNVKRDADSLVITKAISGPPDSASRLSGGLAAQENSTVKPKPDTARVTDIDTAAKSWVQVPSVAPAAGLSPVQHKVRKLLDNTLKTGRQQVYEVTTEAGAPDTVRITIPNDEELAVHPPATPVVNRADSALRLPAGAAVSRDTATGSTKPVRDTAVRDSGAQKPRAVMPQPDSSAKPGPEPGEVVMINSDCRDFASEWDVDKLRIRMLELGTADDRLDVARKQFRSKCFSTRQIRALTELFNTDEERYRFFDAAYPFVSDTDHFKSLLDLLSDPYYINRFKAMVRL